MRFAITFAIFAIIATFTCLQQVSAQVPNFYRHSPYIHTSPAQVEIRDKRILRKLQSRQVGPPSPYGGPTFPSRHDDFSELRHRPLPYIHTSPDPPIQKRCTPENPEDPTPQDPTCHTPVNVPSAPNN